MTREATLVDDDEPETVEGDEEPEDNFVVVIGVDDAEMGGVLQLGTGVDGEEVTWIVPYEMVQPN
jgi:hypothetical protein